LFNHAGWFLMECIRVTSEWFADWPAAYFYVPAPGLLTTVAYYLVLLSAFTGWLFRARWRGWKVAALVVLTAAWCWQWQIDRSITRLTVLPLNGGSAICVDGPGADYDLQMDCGAAEAVDSTLKPFLRAQGFNRLPCLTLSHGDARQVGGAEALLAAFPVGQVATSDARFRSPAYRNTLAALKKTPGVHRVLNAGDRIGVWTVLHPARSDHFPQADDNALVLHGAVEGIRILLASDLGRSGQSALLERNPELRADLVIAGLPQEGEPLSNAFIDAVQPKLILVTDSEFPATRRAPAALCERLEGHGIPVLYLRKTGAVTMRLRRHEWQATSMNGLRISGDVP
jgi:beta-lactamase superfamily II metal-dependent hydrolase